MEQIRYADLALIGMVQHGIQEKTANGGKKTKDLGYFIPKVENEHMQLFLQKFKEQCEGKDNIEIAFCEENPLIKKFERYNQSGKVCHCLEGNKIAKQKIGTKYQDIECSEQCKYRQKNEQGKAACNRVGWLRFLIPSISKDKIWLMKITGQKSINRLDAFFNLQGTLLQNNYILFLSKEDQTSKITGETYKNYILNIMLKSDFISKNTISPQNVKVQSNENDKNVNTQVEKEKISNVQQPITNNADSNKEQKEKTTTKKTTTKSKKETESKTSAKQQSSDSKKTAPEEKENVENGYCLLKTFKQMLTDKDGNCKEYLVGQFMDIHDKSSDIIIRPEDAEELEECGLGTLVKLDIVERGNKKFAMKLEFIEKRSKEKAA